MSVLFPFCKETPLQTVSQLTISIHKKMEEAKRRRELDIKRFCKEATNLTSAILQTEERLEILGQEVTFNGQFHFLEILEQEQAQKEIQEYYLNSTVQNLLICLSENPELLK